MKSLDKQLTTTKAKTS